eukprot:COSAG03_NODE_14055_length_478_cov_1.416887_1_plen_53_part_01
MVIYYSVFAPCFPSSARVHAQRLRGRAGRLYSLSAAGRGLDPRRARAPAVLLC